MMSPEKVLERYYLEVRCKLMDIAAIVDRYERSADSPAWTGSEDDRIARCRAALNVLDAEQPQPNRAEQIALIFSDPVE